MLIVLRTTLSAFALLSLAEFAHADDFRAAPHATFMTDLDTADGAYSVWRHDDVAGLNAMRTQVTFNRKGKGQYAPMFTIRVVAANRSAALSFTAFPKSGPLIGYAARSDASEKDREMLLTFPEFKEPFDVHVQWTPEGKVTFRIYSKSGKSLAAQGFERHVVDLGGAITGVQFSNSTSEVEFGKIELGTESPWPVN